MPIPFKPTDVDGLKRLPLNVLLRDRQAMHGILNPLVKQGRIEPVPLSEPSPAASLAFVVWRNGKPRVVVDLQRVNEKLWPDAYPLP